MCGSTNECENFSLKSYYFHIRDVGMAEWKICEYGECGKRNLFVIWQPTQMTHRHTLTPNKQQMPSVNVTANENERNIAYSQVHVTKHRIEWKNASAVMEKAANTCKCITFLWQHILIIFWKDFHNEWQRIPYHSVSFHFDFHLHQLKCEMTSDDCQAEPSRTHYEHPTACEDAEICM